jgi:hypothetical protein
MTMDPDQRGITTMDPSQLFSGLDISAQRRLWFLKMLCESAAPQDALRLAERMERFVVHGIERGPDEARSAGRVLPPAGADLAQPAATAGEWMVLPHLPQVANAPSAAAAPRVETFVPEPGGERLPAAPPSAAVEPISGPAYRPASGDDGRLLDGPARQAFIAALRHGADNDELARTFGITRRQANGLRMGIVKRQPGLAVPKRAPDRPKGLDRETELRMQEEFLGRRPRAEDTIDDVVRFLRQRGDVIVRAGEDFTVNRGSTLTPSQLVARANQKRLELHRPLFELAAAHATATPLAAATATPAAGAGLHSNGTS